MVIKGGFAHAWSCVHTHSDTARKKVKWYHLVSFPSPYSQQTDSRAIHSSQQQFLHVALQSSHTTAHQSIRPSNPRNNRQERQKSKIQRPPGAYASSSRENVK